MVEAETYRKECELLLGMIQALYDIETRGKDLSWQDRQALRERESTAVLEAIRGWLDTRPLQDVLPKSDFGEALRYIRNHWKELNVYVRDGRIPIDNNLVEQLMKQVAMGRKAWLFVCSVAGGEQSARMMTLVSSARRHDLDVRIYLKDVLDQLLAGCTDYHRLLPDVWKQSHPEAVRQYRVEERRDKADASSSKPPAPSGRPPPPLTPWPPGGRWCCCTSLCTAAYRRAIGLGGRCGGRPTLMGSND